MTLLLLRREGFFPFASRSPEGAPPRLTRPSDLWMGVYFGADSESRVGFANINTNPNTRRGVIGTDFTLTSRLNLMLINTPSDIFITGSAWIPQSGDTAELDFRVRSQSHTMGVTAQLADGQLSGSVLTAGESIPFKFPVSKNLMLSSAMGAATLNLPSLTEGQETTVDTFDPMTFSMGKAKVKCVGVETLEIDGNPVKCKILTTEMNGAIAKAWLTDKEELVKAVTPYGFSLRKIRQSEAMQPIQGGSGNILTDMSITPTGKKPLRGAKRLVIRLSGVSPEQFPPTDDTQSGNGDVYTIIAAEPPSQNSQSPASEAMDDYLKSDAFIQSDHEKIRNTAKAIIGTETDPWRKSQLILQWVNRNLRKLSVFSIPSALEVLESREGDCNEHTVLYTALARSAGVPARVAIGMVWSDAMNGFFYHAWPEVFVGKWIWLEPTLGQSVADATHIKFLNGDIETWTRLLPYLGRLKIEVLETE
jgi:hypothetical protein